jgi:hypothetical protein
MSVRYYLPFFRRDCEKCGKAVRMTGLRYLNKGPPECEAQMLIATFDYAVSTAEVRMKCRPELELSGGKYLKIGRQTVMLIVELEELR